MIFIMLASVMAVSLVAPVAAAPAPQFQNGDVVALVGDSITHGRKWHRYVYEYYLTRFPERQIRFVNQGIAGDSAGGALARLEWDILPWKPNAACIFLGMNDIGRGNYGKANPDQAVLDSRKRALDNYRNNMDKLAEKLVAAGCGKLIFMTPSPYDDTAQIEAENFFGCNAALAQCGQYGRELAAKYQAGTVDLNGPMTALNLEKQKTDPKFTIIGSDRVHPGDTGMLVMAYHFLKDQGAPALVSRVAIDNGKVAEATNAEVTGLKATAEGLEFDCLENALPWVIDPSAKAALELVPVEADLNQQHFAASVPAGDYKLLIDGQEVGQYSAETLKAGINLAENDKTPQYKQALQVFQVNQNRSNIEVKLRTYAQMRSAFVNAKLNEDDDAAVQAWFDAWLAKLGSSYTAYFTNQLKVYRETRTQLEPINQQIEALQQQLWQLNQPKMHHWQLVKVV
ncbi:MAG: SGNH/GDSL hydrolase family protein [Armatimonadota bacterium]